MSSESFLQKGSGWNQKALENKHSEEFFKAIKKYQLTTPWFEELKNISCDGDVPELKWADIQRVNGFQLSKLLPTPKIFQKTQESLKQVLDLIACENKKERFNLVEKMNIHRNYEIFQSIYAYSSIKEHQNYLDKIFQSVMDIDFSSLSTIRGSEVSHQKQLLYYEAFKRNLMSKTILITGAAKRIGREIALSFFDKGWDIVIHYNSSKNNAQVLADEMNARRDNSAIIAQANLDNADEVIKLVDQTLSK